MDSLEKIRDLALKVCKDRGIDLFSVELLGSGKRTLLRVYIDCETGITVEDCAAVSRELSTLLDVEDPIQGSYNLEVSSPGLDRPIRHTEDAKKIIGKLVKIKLKSEIQGRRQLRGRLSQVNGETWLVSIDGTDWPVESADIDKANLIYEFPTSK